MVYTQQMVKRNLILGNFIIWIDSMSAKTMGIENILHFPSIETKSNSKSSIPMNAKFLYIAEDV